MKELKDQPVWFRYTFVLPNGTRKVFEAKLDSAGRLVLPPPEAPLPEWTKLDEGKCRNCPLNSADSPHCPAAAALAGVVDGFRDVISYEQAEVIVESEGRSSAKKAAVQRTLPSLIGLYMATSGCPILEKFKPMARFHLPFASLDETAYRVVTMYATAQMLRSQQGLPADLKLAGLQELYDQITTVNRDFCARLRAAAKEDSLFNSIVSLDVFAEAMSAPEFGKVEQVLGLFDAYTRD